MAKNKTSKTKEDSKAAKPSRKSSGKKDDSFLILSLGADSIEKGSKVVVLNTAETYDAAVSSVKSLPDSKPEYVCIVEKKSLFSRKPQIVVSKIR